MHVGDSRGKRTDSRVDIAPTLQFGTCMAIWYVRIRADGIRYRDVLNLRLV